MHNLPTSIASNWTSIKDIKVPEIMFNPIKLGTPELDTFLSEQGGLVPSQVILFTGEPGVGKTTASMFILSRLAKRAAEGKINAPAFISLEMSDFQLKMQTKRIQHLDRVMLTSRMDDIDNMLRELTIIKPSCVVIDSLQKWAGESNGKQLECVEKFYKWAKKTFIPVIMIGHVNKDGKYKGPSSVLHEIDTHVHMYRDTDTLEVVLSVGKTRFGGHITPLPFSIEPVGLRIGSRYFTPEGERSVADLMKDQGLPGVEDFKTGPYDDKKFETAAKQVIEFLKEEYREEFKRKRKSADKTIIRFRDVKDTYCKSDNSVIQFGLKTIRSWKPGIKSKYAGENFIFDKFCRTHQDNAMEVVCHEFTHLFGYSKHNKEFFTKLVEVCKKVRFAFSDPSLV